MRISRWLPVLGLLLFGSIFAVSVLQTAKIKADTANPQLYVALPPALQMVLAGGDRYLAANIAISRAIVVSVDKLDKPSAHVLAEIQKDAAVLNPYHEDNYYLAAAILPWIDQYDAAQFVLSSATNARKSDALPPFFLGFNYQYFHQDYAKAAAAIRVAAARSVGNNQLGLTALAARWAARQSNLEEAISMVSAMRDQAKDPALRAYLSDRIAKLKGLVWVRRAWVICQESVPLEWPDFVQCANRQSKPDNFFWEWYELSSQGEIRILR